MATVERIEDRRSWMAVLGSWFLVLGSQKVFCGDGGVVEEAVAAAEIAAGVVARRPAERVGAALALDQQRRPRQRRVGGGARGAVGSRHDRRAHVEAVVARRGGGVLAAAAHPAHRQRPRQHGRRCAAGGHPALVDRLQVGQVVVAMDGAYRRQAECARRQDRPERGPLDRRVDDRRAGRRLVDRHQRAVDQLVWRVVQRVVGREDRDHGTPPALAFAII